MNIDSSTKEKINALRILDVADKLGIHYSPNGSWRKALCFCHDDHSPSLGIKPASNKWKCFVCGHGGNHINLVMEHEHINYHDACKWLLREFGITASIHNNRQSLINAIRQKLMNTINNKYLDNALLERFKGTSNEFTRALIQNNILTKEQTLHAIETFRLCTANDSVIFWQIDYENNLREGKVMAYQADCHRSHSHKPLSMSWMLKQEKQLPEEWRAAPCLFGLHQLQSCSDNDIIAVVESEKTAIICSEILPELCGSRVVWMATGGKSNLSIVSLAPLKSRKVILFPDTDKRGETYYEWLNVASQYNKSIPKDEGIVTRFVTVSDILERHANADQKTRKIDIADYIIEARNE